MSRRLIACILLLAALGGCSLLTAPRDVYWLERDVPRPASDAVSLLHYAAYTRSLAGPQLAEETERMRLAHAAEKSDFRLLQYALALSVPGAKAADHRRAQQLLEPLLRPVKGSNAELQALASMMHTNLTELRRMEDGSLAQAQRARDEQRRADELEKKLEALKEIEKSLLRHGKGSGGPR